MLRTDINLLQIYDTTFTKHSTFLKQICKNVEKIVKSLSKFILLTVTLLYVKNIS